MGALAHAARHGRLVLVGGLALGAVAPALAHALEPLIVPLIGALLLLAALRVGPRGARVARGDLAAGALRAFLLQTALPLAALGLFALAGLEPGPLGTGIVLALAASPITGSPGLAILSGADPGPALRQLALGTALLPLTVLPVLWLLPVSPEPGAALAGALRLLVLIATCAGAGLLLRGLVPRLGRPDAVAAVDGLTAIVMALIVVGLMAAVGPALLSGEAWTALLAALALNLGLQAAGWAAARRLGAGRAAPAYGIVAGNRNLAVLLGALPPEAAADLLLFVGCYQVPMYLTPVLMGRLYRRAG